MIESTGSQMTIQNPEDDGPQDLVIDVDAILSAAPAPGGGAVDTVWRCAMTVACNIAIDEQNRTNDDDGPSDVLNAQGEIIRRLKGVLEIDRNYRSEVEAILSYGAEPFITAPSAEAALATREGAPAHEFVQSFSTAREGGCKVCGRDEEAHREAPAEAGEPAVIKGDGFNPQGGGFATLIVDGVRYTADQVRAAIRAQPQAREDAQPVAWRMIGRDGSTISLQAEPYHGGFAHMMESDVGCTVQPLYTHPAPDALRVAVEDIAAERQRQVDAEGWSAERDDEYTDRSLAHAAAAYALGFDLETRPEVITDDVSGGRGDTPVWKNRQIQVPASWPSSWDAEWWKPSDTRRDLVKAGALIIAEIERLDRAVLQAEQK
ncbi:hypothetical protein ACWID1_16090, partial [Brevundimonas sp. NPDC055320]